MASQKESCCLSEDSVPGSRRRGNRLPFLGRLPTPQKIEREAFPLVEGELGPLTPQGHATDAFDDRLPGFQVQETGGVFIQAEDRYILGQKRLELLEARLPHVTKTGIMSPSFSVVPVGNHRKMEAKMGQDIHAFHPVQILPHFIDFVHREGKAPHGESRGTGSYQAPPVFHTSHEDFRNGGLLPVTDCISGTSRTNQNEVGFSERMESLLSLKGWKCLFGFERDDGHGLLNAVMKIGHRLLRQLVHIELEAGGRIQKNRSRHRLELCQKLFMHFHHGCRQLPRPHESDRAILWRHVLTLGNTSCSRFVSSVERSGFDIL